MDESPLIDLAPRTSTLGPGGAASSRVLIFLKGSDVETRGGGLFFEKFDYLQGEVLSSILGFWKGIIRDAWANAVSGVEGMLEDVSSSVSGLNRAVAPDMNISAPAVQTPIGQMSGAAKWGRSLEARGPGPAARLRSTRIGSIEVMTREEVVRQGSTRVRAVQRGGKRRARRLLDRLLERWGLISKNSHELSEFFRDGAWSPTSSKTVHVRTTVMKTAFAQAMRQARDDSASDLAYWRAIMSAFLRPVELQDPIFETAVVLYATSDNKVGGGKKPMSSRITFGHRPLSADSVLSTQSCPRSGVSGTRSLQTTRRPVRPQSRSRPMGAVCRQRRHGTCLSPWWRTKGLRCRICARSFPTGSCASGLSIASNSIWLRSSPFFQLRSLVSVSMTTR